MKETIFSLFEKQQEEEQKAKPETVERMPGEEPADKEEPEAEKAEEKQEPEQIKEKEENGNAAEHSTTE